MSLASAQFNSGELSCGGGPKAGRGAFTLIEVMIVVAIIGLSLSIGIPSIVHATRKDGMRKAVSDMVEACKEARALAILGQHETKVVMNPKEGTIEVPGSSLFQPARLPDNIRIQILGVNWIELQNSDHAEVRFFPNGTSEEFTIVFASDQHEVMKISLDIVTALPDVEEE